MNYKPGMLELTLSNLRLKIEHTLRPPDVDEEEEAMKAELAAREAAASGKGGKGGKKAAEDAVLTETERECGLLTAFIEDFESVISVYQLKTKKLEALIRRKDGIIEDIMRKCKENGLKI